MLDFRRESVLLVSALGVALAVASSALADPVTLQGTVLLPDGKPAVGARVLVQYEASPGGLPQAQAVAGAEGGFSFALEVKEPNRDYTVIALKPGLAVAWGVTKPGTPATIRLVGQTVKCAGQVVDPEGNGLPEAEVRVGAAVRSLVDPAPASPVVSLGDDPATQGSWTGRYGSYAWILCGMSSPSDMVGGQVAPIRCHHDDMTKAYANETIRVTGTGELRYAAWTSDAASPLVRDWIGVTTTDDPRALENPQWGYRTYACWDAGKQRPAGAGVPDMFVRLHLAAGLWRVALYFVDWDGPAAHTPRTETLTWLDEQGQPLCATQVSEFGPGIYQTFAVEGGKDAVLRLGMDRGTSVILSGIFLDSIQPPTAPPALMQSADPAAPGLVKEIQRLSDLYAAQPLEFLQEYGPAYRRLGDAAAKLAAANPATETSVAAARLRWELASSAAGDPSAAKAAAAAYGERLAALEGDQKTHDALRAEGDGFFTAGDDGRAEDAYDAALARGKHYLPETALAAEYLEVAEKFRLGHPGYSWARENDWLALLEKQPPDARLATLRTEEKNLKALADADYQQGHGLVRLPYTLAINAYVAVEKVVGYAAMTPEENQAMVDIRMRQTWYLTGWAELGREQERLLGATPPEKVTGRMLADLMRTYAVLAQTDHSYLAKSEAVAAMMHATLPDGDFSLEGDFALLQIMYHEGQNDKAQKLAAGIIARAPASYQAQEAQRLLDAMKAKG
jgi:hypothetical protein